MQKYTLIKKYSFILVLCFNLFINPNLFADTPIYFCGGSYDPDHYYYNLFNQENISQKAFYPFLRTDESNFFTSIAPIDTENIRLWHNYFNKKYSKQELTNILFNKENKIVSFADLKNSGTKETEAQVYLDFAKGCEKTAVDDGSYYWDYDKILKARKNNSPQLLAKGLTLFESTKNKNLKLRYGYQIIRLYHYSQRYVEAIDFFENIIKTLNLKNEIYYYTLDQIAGCYYKTKKYEKAAYLFLTVFDKSLDRKESAFVSYKFCTYRGAEGKTLIKSDEEKANQIFISALREFSDTIQDLEKITQLGIAEDKQELLLMRIINNLERSIFENTNQPEKKQLFQFNDKTTEALDNIEQFLDKKINKKPTDIAFWQLTRSYISFLKGHIQQAKELLNTVSSNTLNKQKENLEIVYEVFSLKKITTENELWLAALFSKHDHPVQAIDYCYKENYTERLHCNLHGFLAEQISHLYFKEDKIAKAFLMHNYFHNIKSISSHKLVDRLIELVEKPNKNAFEKLLIKEETDKGLNKNTIVNSLNDYKGNIYLRSGDFNKALSYFKPNNNTYIPANVFSNNTMECFSCDSLKVMEDQVYKADAFSFLNKKMSNHELILNLKQLEDISKNTEEKQWKRKLAFYLLGNYFFNISNTGYYRTLNYPGLSYWYNYGFGEQKQTIIDLISNKSTYNFPYVNYYYENTYNALADKAKSYYKNAIVLSSDNELNARCSYMIAKCELNDYYNNIWKSSYYDYDGGAHGEHTTEGFKALKTKYNNTKFYENIRKSCSFFAYYDAR